MIYKGINIGDPGSQDDKFVVDEMPGYFRLIDVKGKTVVDIGAHYGSFTVRAIELGANRVDAYEPNPNSFKLLASNTKKLSNATAHNLAVVHDDRTEVTLYSHRRYSAASTIAKIPLQSPINWKVPCINFSTLLNDIKPEVLKVDCEGTEYDLFLNHEIPDCVTQVVMEIHLGIKKHRDRYQRLIDCFNEWEIVKAPNNRWNICLACWRR